MLVLKKWVFRAKFLCWHFHVWFASICVIDGDAFQRKNFSNQFEIRSWHIRRHTQPYYSAVADDFKEFAVFFSLSLSSLWRKKDVTASISFFYKLYNETKVLWMLTTYIRKKNEFSECLGETTPIVIATMIAMIRFNEKIYIRFLLALPIDATQMYTYIWYQFYQQKWIYTQYIKVVNGFGILFHLLCAICMCSI